LIYKTDAGQFAMSHGSYDLNLGSEILILGGDIMSRSWPNISDSYGTCAGNLVEDGKKIIKVSHFAPRLLIDLFRS
jgi:hypothetical protein